MTCRLKVEWVYVVDGGVDSKLEWVYVVDVGVDSKLEWVYVVDGELLVEVEMEVPAQAR